MMSNGRGRSDWSTRWKWPGQRGRFVGNFSRLDRHVEQPGGGFVGLDLAAIGPDDARVFRGGVQEKL
jgi:hypothetical protein